MSQEEIDELIRLQKKLRKFCRDFANAFDFDNVTDIRLIDDFLSFSAYSSGKLEDFIVEQKYLLMDGKEAGELFKK